MLTFLLKSDIIQTNLKTQLFMKKIIFNIVAIVVALFLIFSVAFISRNDEKAEKITPEFFASAIKSADSLQSMNPFFTGYDFHEWEFKTGENFIRYSQNVDKKNQEFEFVGETEHLDFIFLQDSTVLARISTLSGGHIEMSDGVRIPVYDSTAYEKCLFTNRDNFKKTFKALILDRAKDINSEEDLNLREYFPALRL